MKNNNCTPSTNNYFYEHFKNIRGVNPQPQPQIFDFKRSCIKKEYVLKLGYSHTLTIRVCAAVQGIVSKPFCQEQGTENMHFRLGTACQI